MSDTSKTAAGAAEPQGEDFSSDQAIENAALAGAAAIQRLVAERNNLRARLTAQHREIAALRAFNDELRRRFMVIHQRYVDVAKRVVGELEQFDGTLREVIKEGYNGAAAAPAPAARPDAGQQATAASAAAASLAKRLAETEAVMDTELEDEETLEPDVQP